jgi:alkyl hydroperoxide reductase subunit F
LKAYLETLVQPIELVASRSTPGRRAVARSSAKLLDEIASLSDKITREQRRHDARKPSFEIRRVGSDVAGQFAGIPLGHEFTSLVLALLQVGGHPPKVEAGADRAGEGARRRLPCSRPISRCPATTARTSCRR